MTNLRIAKLIILTTIAFTVFYLTVYGFDAIERSLSWYLGSLNSIKYLLGTVVALISIWLMNKVSRQMYLSFRQIVIKLSLADFVIGIISAVIGLVLGALATVPFAGIPDPWSWMLSIGVVILTTVVAIWAFNLKKLTIIEWFNSIHLFQGNQVIPDREVKNNTSHPHVANYINPMVLDTSAIIDHRIGEIIRSGFLYGTILLPSFILEELQQVADSNIPEKRQRGRLGLKLLQQIKRAKKVTVVSLVDQYPDIDLIDSKLIQLAIDYRAKIITCDYNLNAVGKVRGLIILNINELALNLKHQYLPGEMLEIKIAQAGKEDGQGLGYLADGTLVVVQKGKPFIGKEIKVEIQRILQSAAGRMIFGKALTNSRSKKETK